MIGDTGQLDRGGGEGDRRELGEGAGDYIKKNRKKFVTCSEFFRILVYRKQRSWRGKKIKRMKTYTITLKGTKKNNTQDITVEVLGNNKSQAFNWAYNFFEKGEMTAPFFAKGLNRKSGGTLAFIPTANELMHLKGKYKVHHTSLKVKK